MLKSLFCWLITPFLLMVRCYSDSTIEICHLPPHESCQDYIVFGMVHNDCAADCRELYLLTEYRLYRASSEQSEGIERTYFTPQPLHSAAFQLAQPLFSPPRELLSPKLRPRFVHRPQDEWDYYWQFRRNGQYFKIRFDATDISVPASVRAYMEQLKMVTDSLR
jgi:hypothetical protein